MNESIAECLWNGKDIPKGWEVKDVILINDYCQYDLNLCGVERCLEDKCPRFPGKTSSLYFPEIGLR